MSDESTMIASTCWPTAPSCATAPPRSTAGASPWLQVGSSSPTTSSWPPAPRTPSPPRSTSPAPRRLVTGSARHTPPCSARSGAQRVLLIGAGPAGLELAGEIKAFYPDKHVTIADISPDVLHGPYDQALRDELRRQLDLLGVELRLGSPLREVPAVPPATPASIELTTESGEELNADIWYRCFGVIPQTEYLRGGLAAARDDAGYVRMDEHLRVAGQERIFALGDISDADRDMAGVATAQAQVVAGNVRALSAGTELTAYERYPTAIAVPLGPEGGAGQLPGLDGIAGPDVIADNKGRAMLLDRYAASFDLARGPEAAAESLSAAAEFGKDIVIAFDGSENARHAIRVAARELGGGRAAVLHVWVPLVSGPPRVATSALSARAGSVTHHVTQHPRVPVLAVPQERRE